MKAPKFDIDTKALSNAYFEIANNIRVIIYKRTKAGKDVNKSNFAPYSTGYAKYKAKEFGVRSGKVNLTARGVMLDSMTVKQEPKRSLVYFNDMGRDLVAWVHHTGQGSMPKREFFALTQTEADALFKRIMSKYKVGRFI